MTSGPGRSRLLALILGATMALCALALSACGDSEEDAQEIKVSLGADGAFKAPESAEPGEALISFDNEGKEEAELQFIRVEGDHDAADVIAGLGGAQKGKPFPDWFFAAGGVSAVQGGENGEVTQVLQPGTYYAVNLEAGKPSPDDLAAMKVGGEADDAALESDKTVTASEYQFEADGLEAGENEIAFENVGAQPHHLIVAKIAKGSTIEDVRNAIQKGKGEPPLDEAAGSNTAVIESGETQLVDFDLEAGDYAMMCFISDRQGGPPHAVKGMVDELKIE